jgi:hypothetical protein
MAFPSAYYPATFQERGASVPFTTPLLSVMRVRRASTRGIELITSNPTGGPGIYVTPGIEIVSHFRPTVHDRVLSTRLAQTPLITPVTIRQAARLTAAEGLAGEPAREAAEAAIAAGDLNRRLTYRTLMMGLVRQTDIVPSGPNVSRLSSSLELFQLARQAADFIAQQVGQPPSWTISALETVAGHVSGLGLSGSTRANHVPRLLAMLTETREEMIHWRPVQRGTDRFAHARMVVGAADVAMSLVKAMLANAVALTRDIVRLLRLWATGPDATQRLLERPEWALDGWEGICMIWNHARDDAARQAALVEIARRLPVFPKEASEWGGSSSDIDNAFLMHAPDNLNEDWRNGATMLDLIARNEAFRAQAV